MKRKLTSRAGMDADLAAIMAGLSPAAQRIFMAKVRRLRAQAQRLDPELAELLAGMDLEEQREFIALVRRAAPQLAAYELELNQRERQAAAARLTPPAGSRWN